MMRNTLIHRIPDYFQPFFVHKRFKGFVKHWRRTEDHKGQCVIWVGEVKGWLENSIVPSHLWKEKQICIKTGTPLFASGHAGILKSGKKCSHLHLQPRYATCLVPSIQTRLFCILGFTVSGSCTASCMWEIRISYCIQLCLEPWREVWATSLANANPMFWFR